MTKIRTRVRGGGYTIRRNKTDYNSIVSEAAEVFRKDNELSEKAKEYQKNIETLEGILEKIKNTNLTDDHKKELAAPVIDHLKNQQQDYDKNIATEQLMIQEDIMGLIEEIDDSIAEYEQLENSVKEDFEDLIISDMPDTLDEIASKKEAFENLKNEYQKKHWNSREQNSKIFERIHSKRY